MDFKKLFKKNDKAVSPVIGVILMVAITVILAAAIGSAVFGQGTAQSVPQANLDIQAGSTYLAAVDEVPGKLASVKVEHLGGDPINFAATSTKVTVSVNGSASDTIQAAVVNTDLGVLSVGDIKTLNLKGTTTGGPATKITAGSTVNIKFTDIKTNQLICDKNVRF